MTNTVTLPKTPPRALLVSMAMRLHHDFGMERHEIWAGCGIYQGFTPERREQLLQEMAKLYEEVVGEGFYNWEQGDNQRGGLYRL